MSQRNVERFLGRLVTDEAFRRQFWGDPEALLEELRAAGVDLNSCERRALSALGRDAVARFVADLDPCIQRVDWQAECDLEARAPDQADG